MNLYVVRYFSLFYVSKAKLSKVYLRSLTYLNKWNMKPNANQILYSKGKQVITFVGIVYTSSAEDAFYDL